MVESCTCDASYERVSHQRRSGIGCRPGKLYGISWIVGEGGKSSKEVNPRTMLPPGCQDLGNAVDVFFLKVKNVGTDHEMSWLRFVHMREKLYLFAAKAT